jgi:hypothetical protein
MWKTSTATIDDLRRPPSYTCPQDLTFVSGIITGNLNESTKGEEMDVTEPTD